MISSQQPVKHSFPIRVVIRVHTCLELKGRCGMEYYPPQLLILQLLHMKTITEEYTWLARTEGAMARTTIFLLSMLTRLEMCEP